jgi:hypothetical protein
MGDQPDPTPEQRIRAAVEHTVEMAGKWMEDTWNAVQSFLNGLERLGADPAVQARVRWRAEEDRAMVAPACRCVCEKVHPGAWVCEVKAVTSILHYPKPSGPVDVPVCAPCAAEVMAQPQ